MPVPPAAIAEKAARPTPADPYAERRAFMVEHQLKRRDIDAPRVLAAMAKVPRHEFVPEALRRDAYDDNALPIGHDVTISQPYIVALMTQLADVQPGERVLDVGTGSGYQAAVLAELGAKVWGIEIIEPLAEAAVERLQRLGYGGVVVRAGDGYGGWPEHAPFDAIILAAAPPKIPAPLQQQLALGGKLVAPVGADPWSQELVVVTRTEAGLRTERITPVAFVPMTGEAQSR